MRRRKEVAMRLTHRTLAIVALSVVVCGCSANRTYNTASPYRASAQPAPQPERDNYPAPAPSQHAYPEEPPMVPPAVGVSRVKRVGFMTEVRDGFTRPFASHGTTSTYSHGCGTAGDCCTEGCIAERHSVICSRPKRRLFRKLCFWKERRHDVCCVEPQCAEPECAEPECTEPECAEPQDVECPCGGHVQQYGCGDGGLIAPRGYRQLTGPLRAPSDSSSSMTSPSIGSGSLADRFEDPFLEDTPLVPGDSEVPEFPITVPADSAVSQPDAAVQTEKEADSFLVLPQSGTTGELPLWPRRNRGTSPRHNRETDNRATSLPEFRPTARTNLVSPGIIIQPTARVAGR